MHELRRQCYQATAPAAARLLLLAATPAATAPLPPSQRSRRGTAASLHHGTAAATRATSSSAAPSSGRDEWGTPSVLRSSTAQEGRGQAGRGRSEDGRHDAGLWPATKHGGGYLSVTAHSAAAAVGGTPARRSPTPKPHNRSSSAHQCHKPAAAARALAAASGPTALPQTSRPLPAPGWQCRRSSGCGGDC